MRACVRACVRAPPRPVRAHAGWLSYPRTSPAPAPAVLPRAPSPTISTIAARNRRRVVELRERATYSCTGRTRCEHRLQVAAQAPSSAHAAMQTMDSEQHLQAKAEAHTGAHARGCGKAKSGTAFNVAQHHDSGETRRERRKDRARAVSGTMSKTGGAVRGCADEGGMDGACNILRCRVQKVLGEKGLVGRFSECCMLSHADDQALPPPCWAGLVSAEHARQGRASSPTLVQRGRALCPPRLR
jgi:hypothetical protein